MLLNANNKLSMLLQLTNSDTVYAFKLLIFCLTDE